MSRGAVAVLAVCALQPALVSSAQPLTASRRLTAQQQVEFLRTAEIVKAVPIGKGVTKPVRLTLSDGTLTHDAAFQSINQSKTMSRTGRNGAMELSFADSWRFNIAAHRVAHLLGIGDMVPVSVERSWEGTRGALTWWVDDVLMDEQGRKQSGMEPPDARDWMRQQLRMRVFTQLVYDTDRNQGNILITSDWRVIMIDFTRAFRSWKNPVDPLTTLPRCDRALLAAMRALTGESVRMATDKYLSVYQVEALLARRDVLVAHIDALVARRGEESVLY